MKRSLWSSLRASAQRLWAPAGAQNLQLQCRAYPRLVPSLRSQSPRAAAREKAQRRLWPSTGGVQSWSTGAAFAETMSSLSPAKRGTSVIVATIPYRSRHKTRSVLRFRCVLMRAAPAAVAVQPLRPALDMTVTRTQSPARRVCASPWQMAESAVEAISARTCTATRPLSTSALPPCFTYVRGRAEAREPKQLTPVRRSAAPTLDGSTRGGPLALH